MEGLIDAGAECVAAIVRSCLQNAPYQEETLKLARFTAKLGWVLTQLSLCMKSNEALRGSKTVFLAVDATVSALRQAEQLVTQCAGTKPSSIWPLEDAVEFQSVAAELSTAAGGLVALGDRLPQDVREDAAHIYRQFMLLNFTEDELSETEEQELEREQRHNSTTLPAHPVTAAAVEPPEAGAAPPAAPPAQFTSDEAAINSGAVAASMHAAACAGAQPVAAAVVDTQQRQALQAAAAVAVEAAAEVLSAEGDEEEEKMLEEEEMEMTAEEEALQQDIRSEVMPTGEEGLVVTRDGKTALPAMSPVKGAVPVRGGSPLPCDPFEMSSGADGMAPGHGTLVDLKVSGQGELEVADEVQRQLEAPADFLSLSEQQQESCTASGGSESQVLAALQQLREYELAMGVGEEAEASKAAEEGRGAEESQAGASAPLHKTRSEQAAAVLAQNLEELRTEF